MQKAATNPMTANTKPQKMTQWLRRMYAEQWSTKFFAMEYLGYRSNHVLHGVVALGRLGASEQQIAAFADAYTPQLCVARSLKDGDTSDLVLNVDEAQQWIGKRCEFERLRNLYANEMDESTVDGAIQEHLPNLVGGLAGALLHGVIQLGYAYCIGSRVGVAEGLAYMHYSYLSFEDHSSDDGVLPTQDTRKESKPLTREAAWTMIQDLRQDASIVQELHERLERHVDTRTEIGPLQSRLAKFSTDPRFGGASRLSAQVAAPMDTFDFELIDGRFAVDFSMWLYATIEQNDFVVLHAVTSAWALHQVEHLLSLTARQHAWKTWFRVAISAYIAHDAPVLMPTDICHRLTLASEELPSWETLVANTLALPMETTDPHVFKLVQVALDHKDNVSPTDNKPRCHFLLQEERAKVMQYAAFKVLRDEFVIGVEAA